MRPDIESDFDSGEVDTDDHGQGRVEPMKPAGPRVRAPYRKPPTLLEQAWAGRL